MEIIRIRNQMSVKNRTGYLIINTKCMDSIAVYTYKKGVMDATGATKNDMATLKDWLVVDGWLIKEIEISGFSRERRLK
jgi:hypothetical protein